MAKKKQIKPFHPDEIASKTNIMTQKMPNDLRIFARRRNLNLSTLDGKKLDFRAIEQLKSYSDASLKFDLGDRIVEGLLGQRQEQIKIESPIAVENPADPSSPEWVGRVFHPQLSVPEFSPILRRRGGERVKPNIVVGADNRTIYYPSGYPWHCIGRLYVWNNAAASSPAWTGTGALVGDNVVLTASHVVPWGASSWKMKFVPAHYDGTSIYGAGMETWVSQARGYENTSNVTGWDMATLRLSDNIGTSLGYFGTKNYSSSWNNEPYWTHCGYAGAVSGTRPNWQNGIRVHDTDADSPGLEVEHDGDVTPGDSGGPLFAWWDPGPYIVGTHSGDETEYHFPFSFPRVNVDAGGGALNSLVRWARDNW